jgi:hypothetical protein
MAGHGDGTDRDDPAVLVTLEALVTEACVEAAITASDGDARVAIVSLARGVDPEHVRSLLASGQSILQVVER